MRNRNKYVEDELGRIREMLQGEPSRVKQRLNGYRSGLLKGQSSPSRVKRVKILKDLIKTL